MEIKLIGGPLSGDTHKVQEGWPIPNRFGFPSGPLLHWYITDFDTKTAKYDSSEDDRIERKERKERGF